MTIARNPGDERADEAGWPWSHRKTFLEGLAAQGYAAVTVQEYRTIAGRFCDAIEKRGLRIGDLDGATTERLRHSVLSGVTGSARSYAKCCARRFIERFMAFRFGDKLGDLNAITPDDIVAFLCRLKAGSHPRRQKALPSHIRSLFKFLFWSGKTKRDLAVSLPRVATASDHLPRYLNRSS